tara:strand:- start:1325 stop:1795 length:471 start_codon:yes stop_codon:yes gene_type:complete
MSEFECNISDLIDTPVENSQDEIYETPVKEEISVTLDQQKPKQNKTIIPKKKTSNDLKTPEKRNANANDNANANTSVKDTMIQVILNDMKDNKNHKIIIVTIAMYLLLNSSPIYKLIYDMFPYLMESATKVNIKGQIAIAVLISIAVIISKSSLFS